MAEQSSRFGDRRDAGRALAALLRRYAGRDAVVLALPRGGVPVGYEVAEALGAPLDVFLVRKLGMPGHPEFAMGAIASGGVRVLSDDVVQIYGITEDAIARVAKVEQTELERREREYRQNHPAVDVRGRTVILVDDGLATGSTMRAAVQAVRQLSPARVIVAAPVGAPQACGDLAALADAVVCARTPDPFSAVGLWYERFDQTTDDEVRELLKRHASAIAGGVG
jgi:putative phosphoribosyl transferase